MPIGQFPDPNFRFDNFDPQTDSQKNALRRLQLLSQQASEVFNESKRLPTGKLISLDGKPGVGKTHLLKALMHDFARRLRYAEHGKPEYVIKYFGGQNSVKEFERFATSTVYNNGVHLLCVDDLFANYQVSSAILRDETKALADGLYVAYEKGQLIVTTTNFPVSEVIEKITAEDTIGRIRSRLSQMLIADLQIEGPDFREEIGKNRDQSNPFKF